MSKTVPALIHAWANGAGALQSGNVSCGAGVLWSYRAVIGRRLPDDVAPTLQPRYLVSDERYSVTTSRHQSIARRAVAGRPHVMPGCWCDDAAFRADCDALRARRVPAALSDHLAADAYRAAEALQGRRLIGSAAAADDYAAIRGAFSAFRMFCDASGVNPRRWPEWARTVAQWPVGMPADRAAVRALCAALLAIRARAQIDAARQTAERSHNAASAAVADPSGLSADFLARQLTDARGFARRWLDTAKKAGASVRTAERAVKRADALNDSAAPLLVRMRADEAERACVGTAADFARYEAAYYDATARRDWPKAFVSASRAESAARSMANLAAFIEADGRAPAVSALAWTVTAQEYTARGLIADTCSRAQSVDDLRDVTRHGRAAADAIRRAIGADNEQPLTFDYAGAARMLRAAGFVFVGDDRGALLALADRLQRAADIAADHDAAQTLAARLDADRDRMARELATPTNGVDASSAVRVLHERSRAASGLADVLEECAQRAVNVPALQRAADDHARDAGYACGANYAAALRADAAGWRAEADALAVAAARERIDAWRAGAGAAYLSAADAGALPTMIRVRGAVVETSRGATVPLVDAARLVRLYRVAVRRGGEKWPRGAGPRVGHFRVDSIGADGSAVIGCHQFNADEAERGAALVEAATACETAATV